MAFSPDGKYLVTGRRERDRASLGRERPANRSARSAPTTGRCGPGGGVQPRRPAPGFGERRREGVTVGRDPAGEKESRKNRSARSRRAVTAAVV